MRLQLQGAGYSAISPTTFLVGVLLAAILAASFAQLALGILGFTISVFLAVVGLVLEALTLKASARAEKLAKLWPEVIESMISATSSNYSLVESLEEVALNGPPALRSSFAGFINRIDGGWNFDQALDWLKNQLGEVHADRLIELIRVAQVSGGIGFLTSLRNQAKSARADLALWGELKSKAGWVQGTAKLAILAPWIIVGTLAQRAENVNIYNSAEGLAILLGGLGISVVAYRLVGVLGKLPSAPRVFAT
ncbi:MAG: type II secretion system F family protein [Actinomycetota bacterium]